MICPAECEGTVDLEVAMNWRQQGFVVEEKLDGIRAVVTVSNTIIVTGRRWQNGRLAPLTRAEHVSNQHFHSVLEGCSFDGELMGDTLHVFDLPIFSGEDTRPLPLARRKALLNSLADFLPANFKIVRSYNSVGEMGGFGEGLVWKDLSSKYGFGWFKSKRVETVDVRVTRLLEQGVAETEGHGKVVGVPPFIKPGDVIECEAFKVFDSGKLRNGRFVRTRDDK